LKKKIKMGFLTSMLLLVINFLSVAHSSLSREPLVTVLMASFNRDIYLE